jgi:hypothetical protein
VPPFHLLHPPQIPNVVVLTGAGWLHNQMPTELAGWYLRRLKAKAGDWVLVLNDDPRLPAGLHVRAAESYNVVMGCIYIKEDNKEAQGAMTQALQKAILDCNGVPPIEWEWGQF